LVPGLIDVVVVMTSSENQDWKLRLCVSEQDNRCRSVIWNKFGVSPMESKDPIMVNHKLIQERVGMLIQHACEILCYLKPVFRDQGGARVMRGSIHQYVTDQHECSNADIGNLAQRELWVI
jgi:hypothetical protein